MECWLHVRVLYATASAPQLMMYSLSFAEMIIGYPLFRGRDNADQLVQIMKIVGTPSDQTIQQIRMNSVSRSGDPQ